MFYVNMSIFVLCHFFEGRARASISMSHSSAPLHYTILHHTTLHYTLYYTTLHYTLYYTTLHYTLPIYFYTLPIHSYIHPIYFYILPMYFYTHSYSSYTILQFPAMTLQSLDTKLHTPHTIL